MPSISLSQNNRRILLWGLPILALVAAIFFTLIQPQKRQQEIRIKEVREKGWTYLLHGYVFSGGRPGVGLKSGDIALDAMGRIWLAGDGLHVFDGLQWQSYEGGYPDLAIGPAGEVWAVYRYFTNVYKNGVDIFEGKLKKTYSSRDLGISEQEINQVEITSDGRVWIKTMEFGTDRLVEIVNQQGDYIADSEPELTILHGNISSLDADGAGNLWVGVQNYEDDTIEWPSGLYVFDGETWQRVLNQGPDSQPVVQTRFDTQGNPWILTNNSDVLTYDGQAWMTIVDEKNSPARSYSSGFYLDDEDRLWLWPGSESVHVLTDGTWTSFTGENSGIAGGAHHLYRKGYFYPLRILGVVVDDLDQLWVATSGGVAMIPIQDAEPLSEEIVEQQRQILSLMDRVDGLNWFIPLLLMSLWLSIFLDALPGVFLAFLVGIMVALTRGPQITEIPELNSTQTYTMLDPFIFVPFCGIIGGLAGGLWDKLRDKKGTSSIRLNIILAVIGMVVGFILFVVVSILSIP